MTLTVLRLNVVTLTVLRLNVVTLTVLRLNVVTCCSTGEEDQVHIPHHEHVQSRRHPAMSDRRVLVPCGGSG